MSSDILRYTQSAQKYIKDLKNKIYCRKKAREYELARNLGNSDPDYWNNTIHGLCVCEQYYGMFWWHYNDVLRNNVALWV